MFQYLMEMGVRIPIIGRNMHGDWSRRWDHLTSQIVCDCIDAHEYWRGGTYWKGKDGRFGNQPVIGSMDNIISTLSFSRLSGKPFFVSEWYNPWQNEWRVGSPLLLAAAGSMQDWNGFTIHTYRYSLDEDIDMIGKPTTSNAIGGGYHRSDTIDAFNDPAEFGLFYHAALIFRRADVNPAESRILINANDFSRERGIKALDLTSEKPRTEILSPGMDAKGRTVINPDDELVDIERGVVYSETKELFRNTHKGIGWIDTPDTKAIYGFLGKEGKISINDASLTLINDFGTVAISSLSDEPINASGNMLLTAVGRVDNTNARYNNDHDQHLDVGHGPIQVEIIEAAFGITTDKDNLHVMAIIGYVTSEYKDGVFRFKIGTEYASMYYLIQAL